MSPLRALGVLGLWAVSACAAEASPADAIAYRDDLQLHPGCTMQGLLYEPSPLGDFAGAVRTWPFPEGVVEDRSRPVVLLLHGNSDTPSCWESFPPGEGEPMLAELLAARGIRALALDFRIDRVDDPTESWETGNPAMNVDHGWATPLAERFIETALAVHADRRFAIVAFSFGATVARDALRRLHLRRSVSPLDHIDQVILASGANHGVVSYERLCGHNVTMAGKAACQLGSRAHYEPTPFLTALNGPGGSWETPCADGAHAFGEAACGGHVVAYTTIVMHNIFYDYFKDEFVSEASSRLEGADNRVTGLGAYDESGYFYAGAFRNTFGSIRSREGLAIILERLGG